MNRFRGLAVALAALTGCAGFTPPPSAPADRGALDAQVKRAPTRGDLWRDLAWSDYLAGDAARASDEFGRAAKLLPADPRVLIGRAALAHTAGRIDEARDLWATLLERADPKDPWTGPCEELATVALEWMVGEAPGERALAERLAKIDPHRLVGRAAPSRLLAARAALVRKLGDEEQGAKLDGARGCPAAWRATGPFGTLSRLDLSRPLSPESAEPLSGRAAPTRACVFALQPPDGRSAVMHAHQFVSVPRAMTATITVETDQPWRLFVDGAPVWRTDVADRYPPRRQAIDVALGAGWHEVLLALAVPHTRTDAAVSIVGDDGAPFQTTGERPSGALAPAPSAGVAHVDPAPAGGFAPLRAWLLSYRALRDGDADAGSAAAEVVAAAAPKFVPGLAVAAQLAAEDPTRPARFARDRARRLLERLVELDPKAVRARANLAQMDLQDDHAEKALERLAGASGWRVDFARYQALRARGFHFESERALDDARRENPEACLPIEAQVAIARDRHDVARARRLAGELVRCQPTAEELAELLRDSDDPKGAAAEYRRLLALEPWRDNWRSSLAESLLAGGDAPGAIATLRALIADRPRVANYRVKLADALVAAGDAPGATRVITDGLALSPEAMELHRALLALGERSPIEPYRVDGREVIAAFEKAGHAYEAPAVIVLDRTVTRVFDNGARLTLTHNIVRVQNKDGIDKWGEVSIPEGADVLLLRTVKADGSTREPEEIAEKQSVSVPDLQPGDYVEFEYVEPSASPAAFPGGFLGERFYFQSFDAPLDRTEYVLVTPAAMALQLDRRGAAPTESLERRGDLAVRTFSDHQKTQLQGEPLQTPFSEYVPSVRAASGITTARWRDFLGDQFFGTLRANDEVRALAAKLKTPEAIDLWVRRNIRQGGGLEESATSILSRGEGSRAVLERALLAAAGVPSEIWLARPETAAALDGPLPDLEGFEEPLVAVGAKPDRVVDPRFRHAPPGFLSPLLRGVPALVLGGSGEAKTARIPTDNGDRRRVTVEAKLSEDGDADVKVREELRGGPALEWREALDRLPEDRVRAEFEQRTLGFYFPGASLDKLQFGPRDDDDQPFVVEYSFHAPQLARAEGRRLILPAPYPALLGRRLVGVARRSTALQLAFVAPTSLEATIKLPAGARLERPTTVETGDAAWGHFSQRATAAGDAVALRAGFDMPAGRVSPERYEEFARYANAVDAAEAEAAEIVLK